MRVMRAGLFVWSATGDIVTSGWEFDMEGAPPPTPTDVLACILNHIAAKGNLNASAKPDPIAAQWLTEDVLDRARREGM